VYLPSGTYVTVDLSAADDDFDVEWLDPQTGTKYIEDPVEGGGSQTLYRPFSGTDAVLYLKGRGLGGEPGAPFPEVQGVVVSKGTRSRLDWTAVTGAAQYDVATGYVNNLRSDKSYTRATCLKDNVTSTWFEDSRGNPSRGNGYYYLVRAQGAAGSGGWGKDTSGVERTLASGCP
jgi:hypothetical protein